MVKTRRSAPSSSSSSSKPPKQINKRSKNNNNSGGNQNIMDELDGKTVEQMREILRSRSCLKFKTKKCGDCSRCKQALAVAAYDREGKEEEEECDGEHEPPEMVRARRLNPKLYAMATDGSTGVIDQKIGDPIKVHCAVCMKDFFYVQVHWEGCNVDYGMGGKGVTYVRDHNIDASAAMEDNRKLQSEVFDEIHRRVEAEQRTDYVERELGEERERRDRVEGDLKEANEQLDAAQAIFDDTRVLAKVTLNRIREEEEEKNAQMGEEEEENPEGEEGEQNFDAEGAAAAANVNGADEPGNGEGEVKPKRKRPKRSRAGIQVRDRNFKKMLRDAQQELGNGTAQQGEIDVAENELQKYLQQQQ